MLQVSVITPVYNAEKTVRRAVESAVTPEEVGELLLVDDAGPDDALAVCKKLERQFDKVRLLRHPDCGNYGAGASRNLGIEESRFPLVAFLDADDYYLPNRFKRDIKILGDNATIDGVYGATGIDYEDEEARERFHTAGYAYQEFTTLSAPVSAEELFSVLFHQHPTVSGEFTTDAITVRKSLLDKAGGFHPELRLQQDTHLWRRLAAAGRLAAGIIDRPIAIRGVHGRNRMTDRSEHAKYRDLWWKSLLTEFRRLGLTRKQWKIVRRAYASFLSQRGKTLRALFALARCTFDRPSILSESYGFFDLQILELSAKRKWPIRILSAKNRFVRSVAPRRKDLT